MANDDVDFNDAVSDDAINPPDDGFTLSPAAFSDGVIDYSLAQGAKLYAQAIKSLPMQSTCKAGALKNFLHELKTQSDSNEWDFVIKIPPDLNDCDTMINLLNGYGHLMLKQVCTHTATYIREHIRAAQNSFQLYLCLMTSFTKEGHKKVILLSDDYIVQGLASGPCLLKVIISES
jgi:hypothetical protein